MYLIINQTRMKILRTLISCPKAYSDHCPGMLHGYIDEYRDLIDFKCNEASHPAGYINLGVLRRELQIPNDNMPADTM